MKTATKIFLAIGITRGICFTVSGVLVIIPAGKFVPLGVLEIICGLIWLTVCLIAFILINKAVMPRFPVIFKLCVMVLGDFIAGILLLGMRYSDYVPLNLWQNPPKNRRLPDNPYPFQDGQTYNAARPPLFDDKTHTNCNGKQK